MTRYLFTGTWYALIFYHILSESHNQVRYNSTFIFRITLFMIFDELMENRDQMLHSMKIMSSKAASAKTTLSPGFTLVGRPRNGMNKNSRGNTIPLRISPAKRTRRTKTVQTPKQIVLVSSSTVRKSPLLVLFIFGDLSA